MAPDITWGSTSSLPSARPRDVATAGITTRWTEKTHHKHVGQQAVHANPNNIIRIELVWSLVALNYGHTLPRHQNTWRLLQLEVCTWVWSLSKEPSSECGQPQTAFTMTPDTETSPALQVGQLALVPCANQCEGATVSINLSVRHHTLLYTQHYMKNNSQFNCAIRRCLNVSSDAT